MLIKCKHRKFKRIDVSCEREWVYVDGMKEELKVCVDCGQVFIKFGDKLAGGGE